PVALVFYLMARAGESPADMGLDATRRASGLAKGAALAAVIGGPGLGLRVAAVHPRARQNVGAEGPAPVGSRRPGPNLPGVPHGAPGRRGTARARPPAVRRPFPDGGPAPGRRPGKEARTAAPSPVAARRSTTHTREPGRSSRWAA